MNPALSPLSPDAPPAALRQVVTHGYCIGCGACAVMDSRITLTATPQGTLTAVLPAEPRPTAGQVCPFAAAPDTERQAAELFPDAPHHHALLGRYTGLYAGAVDAGVAPAVAPADDLLTWLVTELLRREEIDGVLHVVPATDHPGQYEYRLSTDVAAARQGASFCFSPVPFTTVLRDLADRGQRYAFVGVPCFVTALRRLGRQDPRLRAAFPYCLALFCGQLRTPAFAEMLAWQLGVSPGKPAALHYLSRHPAAPAAGPVVQVTPRPEGEDPGAAAAPRWAPLARLYGTDPAWGLFQPQACDWCDDGAGELADLTAGHAGLPAYRGEQGDTHVLIVRHPRLQTLLTTAAGAGHLKLTARAAAELVRAPATCLRQRREDLALRRHAAAQRGDWHPPLRIAAATPPLPRRRARLIHLRARLAARAPQRFALAQQHRHFLLFPVLMAGDAWRFECARGRWWRALPTLLLTLALAWRHERTRR